MRRPGFAAPPECGRALAIAIVVSIAGTTPVAADEVTKYLDFCTAVRSQVLTPDRCPFRPEAVVMALGREPDVLVQFVREGIAYEPYQGVVRGAEGTLAAGAGSDWDRAVLLQELFTAAGWPSQFLIIERTTQQAEAAVDAFLAAPVVPRLLASSAPEVPAELPPSLELFTTYDLTDAAALQAQRAANAAWRTLMSRALTAGVEIAPELLAALKDQQLGQSFEAWRAQLVDATRQKVVVLLNKDRSDHRVDLGPETPPADERSGKFVREPPATMLAQLTLELTLTAGGEGARTRPTRLLARTASLATLFRDPLRLEVIPVGADKSAPQPDSWSAADWYTHVAGFERFQALLRVGNSWLASKVFDKYARIHEVAPDGSIEAVVDTAKGFGSALAGGRKPGRAKPKRLGFIETLALRVELTLPGEEPLVQERLIYGRLRDGPTPVFAADGLCVAGPIGPATVGWLTLDAATRNARWIAALPGSGATNTAAPSSGYARLPTLLHQWQLGRLALLDGILSTRPRQTFVSGAALLLRTTQLRVNEADRTVSSQEAIDLCFDGQHVVPREAAARDEALAANLVLGVAGTRLESVLLASSTGNRAVQGPVMDWHAARTAGHAPVASRESFGGVTPSPLLGWALANNGKGRVAVFPRKEQPTSWWSVDPATAAVIGRGTGGEGQALAEEVRVTHQNIRNLKCTLTQFKSILMGEVKSETARAIEFGACLTGLDSPETYFQGPLENMGKVVKVGKTLADLTNINKAILSIDKALTTFKTLGGGQ